MSTLTSVITFKKIAVGAAILGLVAVPSLVAAQNRTSTNADVATAVSRRGASASIAAEAKNTTPAGETNGTVSAGVSARNGEVRSTGGVSTSADETLPANTGTTSGAEVGFEAGVNAGQEKVAGVSQSFNASISVSR